MKRWLMMVLLSLSAVAAWAVPTVDQVEAQVQQGHYTQAESMLREVISARPGSARAHYLLAEVLAHDGRFDEAAREARLARQSDPQIGFTQPDKFRAFEQLLEREQQRAGAGISRTGGSTLSSAAPVAFAAHGAGGVPAWVWGGGLAVAGLLLWRGFSASRRAGLPAAPAPAYDGRADGGGFGNPGNGGPGYGSLGYGNAGYANPGYGNAGYGNAGYANPGYAPAAPRTGSGLLGAGVAAAGGVAAGMLLEKALQGRPEHDASSTGTSPAASNDGGLIPGFFDNDSPAGNDAAQQLEQRPIDFGSGDGWGDDGGAGGSSDDDGW